MRLKQHTSGRVWGAQPRKESQEFARIRSWFQKPKTITSTGQFQQSPQKDESRSSREKVSPSEPLKDTRMKEIFFYFSEARSRLYQKRSLQENTLSSTTKYIHIFQHFSGSQNHTYLILDSSDF